MKQLRSKVSGTVFDIIGETDEWWWIRPPDTTGTPLTVERGSPNWEEFVRTPTVGDVWRSGSGTLYRVIGIDEPNKLAHWVVADEFHYGDYPALEPGDIQADRTPCVTVYTRELDEQRLTFVRGLE